MSGKVVRIQLESGCNVDMSVEMHDAYFCHFTDSQLFRFSNSINAEQYFPQVVQFAITLVAILKGKTSFTDILLSNSIVGIASTSIWFMCRLYKVPGLSFISCLVGSLFFRTFLHFIPIVVISFFVIKDWKVLVFCIISGMIVQLVKSIICASWQNPSYNDEVIRHVTKTRNRY